MANEQDVARAGRAIIDRLANVAGKAFKLVNGNGVTVKEHANADALIAALENLMKRQVLVGVPREEAAREDGALNNAARLYIHEWGAPEANIPARPTVMPGIRAAKDKIELYLAAAARAAITPGRQKETEINLHRAGLVAADGIKAMIDSNVPPPLSEKTLADRRERGVTRTNTLIDFAEMRNAVTYVLRDK